METAPSKTSLGPSMTATTRKAAGALRAAEAFTLSGAHCVETMVATAVLLEAAEDLQKFRREPRRAGQMLYGEVRDWVNSDDRGSPGSFLNVCNVLQLTPERVRSELLIDGAPKEKACP